MEDADVRFRVVQKVKELGLLSDSFTRSDAINIQLNNAKTVVVRLRASALVVLSDTSTNRGNRLREFVVFVSSISGRGVPGRCYRRAGIAG